MSVAKEIRDLMGRCSRLEQQISKLPTRIGNSAGGGGTGGGWAPIIKETREELPADPPDGSIGFVTTGVYAGGIFTYRESQWRGLNFWEQEEAP